MRDLKMIGLFSLVALTAVGCSKAEDDAAGTGLSVSMPTITGAVSSTGSSSTRTASAALLLNEPTSCDSCTSTEAKNAFMMSLNFVSLGQGADSLSCIVKALINGGDLKADGTPAAISEPSSGMKIKIAATVTDNVVTSYSLHGCDGVGATLNSQYSSGTVGTDGTTTLTTKIDYTRNPTPGTIKANFTVSGTFLDGAWQSKSVSMKFTDSNTIQESMTTQGSDHMIVKGSFHGSGTDVQLYAKYGLLGNSAATYAMDAGSSKQSVNSGADANASWDTNGNTGGSAYLTDVTSGTYLPVPSSYSGGISGAESWDCSTAAIDVINFQSISAASQAGIMACDAQ